MNSISRRDFIRSAGISSAAWLATRLPSYAAVKAQGVSVQPNILFIMPDQMRGDCLSLLGHPVVRTPHLDQLATEGALFSRAYSTCPSCIPARYALLTGQFPQTSGVVGFKNKRVEVPTLPQLMTQVGYTTVLVGRNMHQVPDNVGYQKQVLGSTYVEDDDYDKFLKAAAPDCGGVKNLILQRLKISVNTASAAPWPLAEELHPTAWTVRQARKELAEAPNEKPLFLTASFYAPHPPLFAPVRYFEAYQRMKLPNPAHGDWVDWKALSPKGDKGGHRILLEGTLLRDVQAGYFGLIEQLDNQIAPLIADFKAQSRKNNRPWVIVFSTDHGELLGDHGYFRKCEPYEGSASIPFIIAAAPELGFRAGLRCAQPVCLEDIMPTLLDLAGTQCPTPLDGVSLTPTLRGTEQNIRSWLHFEHAPCYSLAQAFHALTDGHFKYIWRPTDGTEQLFNLDKDPQEIHDLARDAAAETVLKEWRARLIQRLAKRPEGFSDGTKLIAGRPYPPVQKRD